MIEKALSPPVSPPRVNEIDLLRFIAALSVVFFHYSFRGYAADGMSSMPYPLLADVSRFGYFGVHLFFMISGFVILMTAASGSLRSFVISRIVRLYPAFWACCTITFLVTIAFGAPRFVATLGQYAANMTMMGGFWDVEPMDGSYWSLFVEMRFYALVMLVLLFQKIQHAQLILAAWLVATLVLEVFHSGHLRYLLITDYSAFFIAGATFFLIWANGISVARLAIVVASWLIATYKSLAEMARFDVHFHTHMNRYQVMALITLFFLAMALIALRRTGVLARKRWLMAGAMTYPLYLLHQYLGFIVFNAAYPKVNAHVLFWGMLATVLCAALAVNVWLERPISVRMKAWLNRLTEMFASTRLEADEVGARR